MTQGRGMPRPYMGMTNFVLKMTGQRLEPFFSKVIHKNDHPIWGGRYIFFGDPYWIRTSDLFPVKEAL